MFFVTVGLSLAFWTALPQRAAVQAPVTLDAKVAGRVIDAVWRRPIADATVMLVPTVHQFPAGAINTTAITDANGKFSIQSLPRGRYRIYVRKTGFARITDPSNAPTIDVAAGQSVTGCGAGAPQSAAPPSFAGGAIDQSSSPAFGTGSDHGVTGAIGGGSVAEPILRTGCSACGGGRRGSPRRCGSGSPCARTGPGKPSDQSPASGSSCGVVFSRVAASGTPRGSARTSDMLGGAPVRGR